MNLILLGPPGTGKGTIAKFIEKRFNCTHISTGDLLREEVASQTELGKKIAPIMASGKLVEDEIVVKLVIEKISKLKRNFVLDGFPRNINQGEHLDYLLKELGIRVDAVLEIDSSEDVIIKRLAARRQCVKCKRIYGLDVPSKEEGKCDDCHSETILREDDKPEVVKKRLKLYNETTKPLIEFYKNKKILIKVDGNRPLQQIFEEIEKIVLKIEEKK
ncbi:MAG: adenylate kinase [Candidatus Diapherotrites archaeon]